MTNDGSKADSELDPDRWETLAAADLRKLARRDMRAWKERVLGQNACDDEDQPMPSEVAKLIGEMKRVRRDQRAVRQTGAENAPKWRTG